MHFYSDFKNSNICSSFYDILNNKTVLLFTFLSLNNEQKLLILLLLYDKI